MTVSLIVYMANTIKVDFPSQSFYWILSMKLFRLTMILHLSISYFSIMHINIKVNMKSLLFFNKIFKSYPQFWG